MKSVLIIKLSSIGDIVMATAAVSHLKQATGASVTWVVDEGMASLLEDHPLVDELLLYPRDPFNSPSRTFRTFAKRWTALLQQLRARTYDVAIDLQGRPRTYLLLQSAQAKHKIGRGFYPFLPRTVRHKRSVQRHAVLACFESLDFLGLPRPLDPRPVIPLRPQDENKVRSVLEPLGTAAGQYAVILPATTWPSKNWPEEYWAEVADWLVEQGLASFSSGHPGIIKRARGSVRHRNDPTSSPVAWDPHASGNCCRCSREPAWSLGGIPVLFIWPLCLTFRSWRCMVRATRCEPAPGLRGGRGS